MRLLSALKISSAASWLITLFCSLNSSVLSMVTAGKSKEVSSELDSNSGRANTSDPSLALSARSSAKFAESLFEKIDVSAGASLTSVLSSSCFFFLGFSSCFSSGSSSNSIKWLLASASAIPLSFSNSVLKVTSLPFILYLHIYFYLICFVS